MVKEVQGDLLKPYIFRWSHFVLRVCVRSLSLHEVRDDISISDCSARRSIPRKVFQLAFPRKLMFADIHNMHD